MQTASAFCGKKLIMLKLAKAMSESFSLFFIV
ncbi:hypothetical protein CUPA0058 [Campylobacter upsaliensis RM3195]|nr:hypothetical protein CUPA0058 [Campylobacter upsaliensis RM3195]